MSVSLALKLFIPSAVTVALTATRLTLTQTYNTASPELLEQAAEILRQLFPQATVTIATKKLTLVVEGERLKALLYIVELFGLILLSEG